MSWPPAVLPVNRTNATPQLDTHAADHNALALAVNDTVGKVQAMDTTATALAKIVVGSAPGGDINPGGNLITASLTLGPAGIYLITYGVNFLSTGALTLNISILLGGVTQYLHILRTNQTQESVFFGAPVQSLVNAAGITCKVDNLGGAVTSCYADPSNHRLASIAGH